MSAANIYLLLNEVQTGPFTAEELHAMQLEGRATPATLYWQEGMDEWQELRVVFGETSQEKSPTRAIPTTPAQSASIELDYSSERRTVSRTARDYFIKFGVIGLIILVGIYAVTHYITGQKTRKAQQDRIAKLREGINPPSDEYWAKPIKENINIQPHDGTSWHAVWLKYEKADNARWIEITMSRLPTQKDVFPVTIGKASLSKPAIDHVKLQVDIKPHAELDGTYTFSELHSWMDQSLSIILKKQYWGYKSIKIKSEDVPNLIQVFEAFVAVWPKIKDMNLIGMKEEKRQLAPIGRFNSSFSELGHHDLTIRADDGEYTTQDSFSTWEYDEALAAIALLKHYDEFRNKCDQLQKKGADEKAAQEAAFDKAIQKAEK